MYNQEPPSVGRFVHRIVDKGYGPELAAQKESSEFVVVAGIVCDLRTLAALTQQLLDHVVM
jgi:hypothetical protein